MRNHSSNLRRLRVFPPAVAIVATRTPLRLLSLHPPERHQSSQRRRQWPVRPLLLRRPGRAISASLVVADSKVALSGGTNMKTRIDGLVSALLICTAAAVHADPIVITSGSAMVDPSGDPLRFSIGGDDFSAMGRWNTPFAVPFFSCSHGCGKVAERLFAFLIFPQPFLAIELTSPTSDQLFQGGNHRTNIGRKRGAKSGMWPGSSV